MSEEEESLSSSSSSSSQDENDEIEAEKVKDITIKAEVITPSLTSQIAANNKHNHKNGNSKMRTCRLNKVNYRLDNDDDDLGSSSPSELTNSILYEINYLTRR